MAEIIEFHPAPPVENEFAVRVARKITVTVTYEYEGGETKTDELDVRPETFMLGQYRPLVQVESGEMVQAKDLSFVMHGLTQGA